MCRSSEISRTITSPLLSPTRTSIAAPCARRTSLGVPAHRLLHRQRGVAGADGVVLVGDRRPEQRHQAVAHQPADGALVAVDGVHHHLHGAVQQPLGVLGVEARDQLGRADDVGEQDGDLLALAFERGPRGQDLLGQVPRRVALRESRQMGAMPATETGCAHSMQNLAASGSAVPQEEHRRASGAAHSRQNLAWGGFSVLQAEHRIARRPCSLRTEALTQYKGQRPGNYAPA